MANVVKPSDLIAYGDVPDPRGANNVKHAIRQLLKDTETWEAVKPYVTNGGECGHKMMDITHALIILNDKAEGKLLTDFGVPNMHALATPFKNVLRERYAMNSKWKIEGYSYKAEMQMKLANDKASKEAPQE